MAANALDCCARGGRIAARLGPVRPSYARPGHGIGDARFHGDWHFCRLAYRGRSWATDYPDADYNFSTRLSELTKTPVSKDSSVDPRPLIVRPTDERLFQCPFVMLWQAESLYLSDENAVQLRRYLLKGGFIWSDDSWGAYAWNNFADEIAKVLPRFEYASVDVPPNHSMFRTRYDVPRCLRFPASASGGVRAVRRPSGAPTAHTCTCARLSARTDRSWFSPRTTPISPMAGSARA